MIRVAHVLWTAGFGGIERLVLDLTRRQKASAELEPGIVLGQGGGGFADEFEGLGVPLHVLGLCSGRDLRPARRRRAEEVFAGYDVLHFHSFNPLLAAAARSARSRVVYTEHGNFGFGRRRRLSDWINDRLRRRFLNREVDFVTFNSKFTRGVAEERFGLETVDRRVVYNGIEQEPPAVEPTMDPEITERLGRRFVVGTVCRLAGFKRVDRLLDAFAAFSHRDESVLLIVGDGPERPQLESQAERLQIAGNVLFAGYRDGVRAYQQRMDVCVCPSVGEPFGLVAVEALMLGRPVVVLADGGGLVEIVSGLDADDVVADIPALARRLEHHFESDLTAGAASRIGRARRFEIGRMAEDFSAIYAAVVPPADGDSPG